MSDEDYDKDVAKKVDNNSIDNNTDDAKKPNIIKMYIKKRKRDDDKNANAEEHKNKKSKVSHEEENPRNDEEVNDNNEENENLDEWVNEKMKTLEMLRNAKPEEVSSMLNNKKSFEDIIKEAQDFQKFMKNRKIVDVLENSTFDNIHDDIMKAIGKDKEGDDGDEEEEPHKPISMGEVLKEEKKKVMRLLFKDYGINCTDEEIEKRERDCFLCSYCDFSYGPIPHPMLKNLVRLLETLIGKPVKQIAKSVAKFYRGGIAPRLKKPPIMEEIDIVIHLKFHVRDGRWFILRSLEEMEIIRSIVGSRIFMAKKVSAKKRGVNMERLTSDSVFKITKEEDKELDVVIDSRMINTYINLTNNMRTLQTTKPKTLYIKDPAINFDLKNAANFITILKNIK